jgi:hypothetical protein
MMCWSDCRVTDTPARASARERLRKGEAYFVALDLLAALEEIHEYHCGCDRPGDLAACVAQPVVVFAILREAAA